MPISDFPRFLRLRRDDSGHRLSISRLAYLAQVGRSHLSQVVHGHRPGGETWPKIFLWITIDEARLLGQLDGWNRFHGKQITPPHA